MNKEKNSVPWIITVCLFSSIFITRINIYGSYVILGITALMLIASAIQKRGSIRVVVCNYHYHVLVFALYCLTSSLWAENQSDPITKALTIIEILLCLSVFYSYYSQENNGVDKLLRVIMWSGFLVVTFTIIDQGFNTFRALLGSGGRLASSFNNVNEIAGLCALTVVITVYFWLEEGFSVYRLLIIPSMVVLIACGSKRAIIILILGVVLLFVFRQLSQNEKGSKWKTLLLAGVLLAGAIYIASSSIVSGVFERMNYLVASLTGSGAVDHSTMFRRQLIEYGFEIFKRNPLFGIGMGCPHNLVSQRFGIDVYLHNNFVELLAGGGIIGFLIYYSMYFQIFKTAYRYGGLKNSKNHIIFVIIIYMLITDVASGTYYSKETYFILMVCYLHVNTIRQQG